MYYRKHGDRLPERGFGFDLFSSRFQHVVSDFGGDDLEPVELRSKKLPLSDYEVDSDYEEDEEDDDDDDEEDDDDDDDDEDEDDEEDEEDEDDEEDEVQDSATEIETDSEFDQNSNVDVRLLGPQDIPTIIVNESELVSTTNGFGRRSVELLSNGNGEPTHQQPAIDGTAPFAI